mgnify:CR=1 FL=1
MKKIIVALMCLSFTATAFAQDAKPKQSQEALKAKGPKFKFKGGDIHDFGKIPEGPAAEYTFEFTNVGNEPLIIQNASASCGCTTPEWPKEPILPGNTGKIKVKYNTQGRGNQPFDKSVYISSNASTNNERYELHIKGFVTGAGNTTGKK